MCQNGNTQWQSGDFGPELQFFDSPRKEPVFRRRLNPKEARVATRISGGRNPGSQPSSLWAPPGDCCASCSQEGISPEQMSCRGEKGLSVPAWTLSPSLNFPRAKSLASASVSNVLVIRGFRLLGNTPRLGATKVTNQVCGISHPSARSVSRRMLIEQPRQSLEVQVK